MTVWSSIGAAAESNLRPNDLIKNVSETDRTLNQLDSHTTQPDNYLKSNGIESKKLQLIPA